MYILMYAAQTTQHCNIRNIPNQRTLTSALTNVGDITSKQRTPEFKLASYAFGR